MIFGERSIPSQTEMIVLRSPSCVFIPVLNYMNTNSLDAGCSLAVVAVVALCLPLSPHTVIEAGLKEGGSRRGGKSGWQIVDGASLKMTGLNIKFPSLSLVLVAECVCLILGV